ncbi:E3 ubiquitin-protein ligase UBR4-like [Watersipora subatra]|uniref:E3 ubiquitin-protein ligase UBR4-like n=1 Tax=Watersipora subatra TaxID=2589382 RepID=UPI00355B16A9
MERSARAELELIVLRLFSVLMSRSHQYDGPTAKSGSRIATCAASILINTKCLDFFLPLLTQLLNFWKGYNPESDTGAHMRFASKSTGIFDMSPFFLKQYVKEHPMDVFEVFPQLQTEMVLRLINQIKKISDHSSELKLTFSEEWTRVLSDYMVVCEAAFIKRQVRKLLNSICGTKDNYRRVRDINTINSRMTMVKDSAMDCGVTENLAGAGRTTDIPYTTLTAMVENLKVVQEIASSRCVNWQKYCTVTPGTVELMLLLCVQTTQGLADPLISLLRSAVTAPTASKSSSPSTGDDVGLHKQIIQEMMTNVRKDLLSEFLRVYLLQTNQTPLRTQMHGMVLSLYEQGNKSQRSILLNLLWTLWPQLSYYGKKASMFVDLMGHMIIQTDLAVGTKQQFVRGVIDLLSDSNGQLKHHQNTNIYNMLQELVDLDGYYLEREPCMTCNDPEISYSNLKLNNIKVDNKFSTTTQMIKLTGSHMISRIHIRITDIKKSKMVKALTINYSSRTVLSAVELKHRVGIWQLAKRVNLTANQSDVKIDFSVPITACNLMIEYSDFYENKQPVIESLPCPRCSASVPANPGICVNCGENVFQCHKCRSINYDEKDPFLCNTCGFCKYAKFDMTLTARACSAVDPIETEEDRTKTMSYVNLTLDRADKTYGEIQNTRSTLERLIMQLSGTKTTDVPLSTSSGSGHVNKFIQQVALKYCDESRKLFEELSKAMQKVLMSRRELLEFDRKSSLQVEITPSSASVSSQTQLLDQLRAEAELNEDKLAARLSVTHRSSSGCYGCLTATVNHCITLLHALTTQSLATSGARLIEELVSHNLNSGPMMLRRDAMLLLCTLTKDDQEATTLLYDKLYQRITEAMEFCTSSASLATNIRSEMMVISLSVNSDVTLWEERMKTVIRLYSAALKTQKSHVIEAVALSCLEIIKGQIISGRPTTPKHLGKTLQDIADLRVSGDRPAVDVERWLEGGQGHTYADWVQNMRSPKKSTPSERVSHLAKKYFNLWRRNMSGRLPVLSELKENSWLSNVLFNPASQTSREMCAEIVNKISEVRERKLLLAAALSKLLGKVPTAGTNATQFIQLYRELIEESETKYYLVVKHDLPKYIAEIISSEIEALCVLEEATLGSDLGQGWGLHALVSIVKSFIDDERIRQRYKSRLVGTVLDGYLSLRKLVVQRTKMIESTQELLLGLLETLTTGTEAETRAFMSVCVQTVTKYSPTDLRSPVFIFERLCSIIRPEESGAKEFLLVLEKDSQQEDFLQGRMSGNPYMSKEPGLGPLMRDVKNKICTDCELVALLEDDNGMELLVNNKIISLDLPVADVYRKIWQPTRENEPMRVIYRMRGLLGDATEDMVNSLQSNDAEEEDSDTVYRMAAVMQQGGGLDVMLRRLDYIHNYHKGKQLVSVLLKLFDFCLKLKVNRAELIKPEKDTISVMLRALNRALRAEQQSSQGVGVAVQPAGQSNTEKVLQIMEIVLSEASRLPPEQYTEFTKRCGDSDQLMLLLDRINSPFVRSHSSVLQALMKLIPFLACGEEEKMNTLLEHFRPYLKFLQFDVKQSENDVTYLECFCVITSGIKENANGSRLKQMIINRDILSDAIEYIRLPAPPVTTLLATDADEWKDYVSRAGLPYVLRFLTGLCAGHAPSQDIVGERIVCILHKLEHMSSHGQIGSLAENLMETLCQNEQVGKQIERIRKQTKDEKKRLAMMVREKHLSSIGMKTNTKGQVVSTSALMKEADNLKEESGVICSICREGYHNQPNKVLAVYTFTKKVTLEEAETRSRKSQGILTVSHMNLVHVDCHSSAVKLASSRDEWESAALHNSNTKCNGLLPLWGPQVSEHNFATALAKHNLYLRDCIDLRDDYYNLTVHDIKLLLLKFAREKPFSVDGGGGGRNSNMLLIPYQIMLVLYVMSTQNRSAKLKEQNFQTFIGFGKAKWVEACWDVDGPIYWLIMSIVLWSRDEWNKNKLVFLERLVTLSQARKTADSGGNKLKDKTTQAYSVYKPMLILFDLVDSIFNIMFKNVPTDKDWQTSLMAYIRNNDMALAESSEKIVNRYESELLPCESLAEMFDVCGLLGEIPDPDTWLKELLLTIP